MQTNMLFFEKKWIPYFTNDPRIHKFAEAILNDLCRISGIPKYGKVRNGNLYLALMIRDSLLEYKHIVNLLKISIDQT